ncbi:unnamed protein product [Cylicocyclus nassatus]|uniref:Uncharacterized protein n=1 Tax=Cylicocyclus nassatus TaxID=53992 RepID=A0AA36GPC4_CYLNA|nr:unnamed protein product [Cylicocyclus nassatus]
MKHVFLLLIQVALATSAKVTRPDYSKFATIVPARFRDGHRYYTDVDNVKERRIFKPIALYAMRKEVLFGEFNVSSGCATFASHRNVIQKCDYQFFLLHSDYSIFSRITLSEYFGGKKCKAVEFANNMVLLVKHDVSNFESPKAVGTYSRERNAGYVINHLNKKVSYRYLTKKLQKQYYGAQMFEVLCQELLEAK